MLHILCYAYYTILDYTHTIIYYTFYLVHTLHWVLYILQFTYCTPACELECIEYCKYYMLHRILYIDHIHTIHIIPHILSYAYCIILDYTNHTVIYYTYHHVHTLHLALYILHCTYCMPACELEYIKYCT